MEPIAQLTPLNEDLPPMYLRAFLLDDRQQLLRFLPAALSSSGAWLLRHEATSSLMRFFFEFERSNGMNVYVMLVGIGLELTRSSHLSLTSFCQRTMQLPETAALQVATCDLEVTELLEDESSGDPLIGENSRT
jgi:hypothetical protein